MILTFCSVQTESGMRVWKKCWISLAMCCEGRGHLNESGGCFIYCLTLILTFTFTNLPFRHFWSTCEPVTVIIKPHLYHLVDQIRQRTQQLIRRYQWYSSPGEWILAVPIEAGEVPQTIRLITHPLFIRYCDIMTSGHRLSLMMLALRWPLTSRSFLGSI